MPSARTVALIHKLAKANNEADTEAYAACLHEDAVRKYGEAIQRGKDALKAFRGAVNGALVDRKYEIARNPGR